MAETESQASGASGICLLYLVYVSLVIVMNIALLSFGCFEAKGYQNVMIIITVINNFYPFVNIKDTKW